MDLKEAARVVGAQAVNIQRAAMDDSDPYKRQFLELAARRIQEGTAILYQAADIERYGEDYGLTELLEHWRTLIGDDDNEPTTRAECLEQLKGTAFDEHAYRGLTT